MDKPGIGLWITFKFLYFDKIKINKYLKINYLNKF